MSGDNQRPRWQRAAATKPSLPGSDVDATRAVPSSEPTMPVAKADDGTLTYHRQIRSGAIAVIVFGLLAKFVGAGKEMVLAWQFGTSPEVDAFQFAFSLYALPIAISFSVLSGALVPTLSRLNNNARPHDLGVLTVAIGLVGLGLAATIGLAASAALLWGNFVPDDRQSERMLLSMMALWPIVPVLMIANLFACRSLAEGSQRATLLEAMPALLMILTVILWPSRSIVPVMIGLITGAALQMALLARSMPRGSRWHWRNSPFKGELWLTISPFLIWLTVIYGLMAVAGAIDTLFAAALPTGSIATLSYATRLVSLALTLIGMAGSRALLPVLSSVAVQKPHMLSSIVTVWAAIAFVVGCIGVAVTWWLGRPAIVLLFERGAFNADDTEQVTAVLKLLMMQLPFAAVVMVLMQPLLAERRFSALVGLAVVSLMAKLVSAPLLIDYAGLQGLAFSNAVTGACQLVYLVCIYGVRRMPPIQSS